MTDEQLQRVTECVAGIGHVASRRTLLRQKEDATRYPPKCMTRISERSSQGEEGKGQGNDADAH